MRRVVYRFASRKAEIAYGGVLGLLVGPIVGAADLGCVACIGAGVAVGLVGVGIRALW